MYTDCQLYNQFCSVFIVLIQGLEINQASCRIARRVAGRRGTLIAGGIMQTAVYNSVKGSPEGREKVQKELGDGLEVLVENGVDIIFCEVRHRLYCTFC